MRQINTISHSALNGKRYRFTLIELLVVIAIIAILAAILLVMAVLISGRFMRTIFKSSAMGTYREEA